MKQYLKISFLICTIFICICGCATTPSISTNAVANEFIGAVNNSDVPEMNALSSLPVFAQEQSWVSAKSGYGYVLGEHKKLILDNVSSKKEYLGSLSSRLKLDDTHGNYIPLEEYSRYNNEFGGLVNQWKQKDAFLFLRGMGDVEHIVILGVNRKNKKVEMIYIN